MSVESIITENIDIWTSAIKTKSASGRGSSKKLELFGINKLRELILEFAVRGKLVQQNHEDVSADYVLAEISKTKSKLLKEKAIKSAKVASEKEMPEVRFETPRGWGFVPIEQLLVNSSDNIVDGPFGSKLKASEYVESGVPILRIQNIDRNKFKDNGIQYVTKLKADELKRHSFKAGDIILNKLGEPAGKACIVPKHFESGIIVADIVRIRLDTQVVSREYLTLAINAPLVANQFSKLAKGITRQRVNLSQVRSLKIPVPPVSEQISIVREFNKLMLLCDQLESQTEASIEAHQTLVKSLLETLTNAKDADELNDSWQRISEHFDVLFTTEDSIDQLKQTILQLAVMGKLVKQDPNDEPASKLLERIAAEKEQLIKDKKIKKQKPLPATSEDEKPFQLPHGWAWTRFSDFVNEVATGPFGSMIHKSDYIDGGIPLINPSHMINGKIQEDSAISVSELKAEELSSYKLAEGDLVMARRGEMGRSALVTKRENNWLCGTGSFVLKFNDKVSREFLLLLFKTDYVKNYLGGNSVGSTMTNLNHGILYKMPFLIPPVAEQERVVQKVKILFSLCDKLKLKINDTQLTKIKASDLIGTKGLSSL